MRLYGTIIPEIQKTLGDEEADFVVNYNRKIESEFFWSSMISTGLTAMMTLALIRK